VKDNSQDIIENLYMVAPVDPWWWVKLVVGVLILGIAAMLVIRRLHRKKMLPFQKQPVPLETSALESLAAIRHLIAEGRMREFVDRSSTILRHYIENRFALSAPRLSTEEFLHVAEQSQALEASRRERLAEFLYCCDRVKFALRSLDADRMEELYATAENFVRETVLPTAPAEPATQT
jgi:hypothetical protein